MEKTRQEYIDKIVERSGLSMEEVDAKLDWAERNLGVSPALFTKYKFETRTRTQQGKKLREVHRQDAARKEMFKKIYKLSGQKRAKSKAQIKEIKSMGIYRLKQNEFYNYGFFTIGEERWMEVLTKLAALEELKAQVKSLLDQNHDATKYADEIGEIYEEGKDLIRDILPKHYIKDLIKMIEIALPKGYSRDNLEDLAIDMETVKKVIGFGYIEYLSFNFFEIDIASRLEYIMGMERLRWLRKLNSLEGADIMDNKYETYLQLKKYYRRKVLCVDADTTFEQFKRFIFFHRDICVKTNFGAFGKNVRKVNLKDYKDKREMFDSLREEFRYFILEDIVHASPKLKALNPDSLNTIRITTYFDGEKVCIDDAFIKMGRKGSFVDNGGSGGLFAHVCPLTGQFDSIGCDEEGIRYECHPDTGVALMGYQLPDWDKAIALAKEVADKVPGVKYAGWDLGHDEKKGWVIIEGNAYTQFLGQQCTVLEGKRKAFLDLVD